MSLLSNLIKPVGDILDKVIPDQDLKRKLSHEIATKFSDWGTFDNILATDNPKFIFLGSSKHKIKKKAEQEACRLALETIGIL